MGVGWGWGWGGDGGGRKWGGHRGTLILIQYLCRLYLECQLIKNLVPINQPYKNQMVILLRKHIITSSVLFHEEQQLSLTD